MDAVQAVRAAHLLAADGHDVALGDVLLAVGQLLELFKGAVQLMLGQLKAQLLRVLAQGVPAAELAQHHPALGNAQLLGLHDLVGGALAEHPVLVDAALVHEGVGAHDGLVGRNLHAA